MLLHVFTLNYTDIKVNKDNARLLRGYFTNKFKTIIAMHNHKEDGSFVYGYPLIQYKIIDSNPVLIGIGRGADILKSNKVFLEDELILGGKKYKSNEQDINIDEVEFGVFEEFIEYKFITSWLPLNQENYAKYQNMSLREKDAELNRILTGNIISMCKSLGYQIPKEFKLEVIGDYIPCKKLAKNKSILMNSFNGVFRVNFKLPDYIGLGKSVTKGNGVIRVLR